MTKFLSITTLLVLLFMTSNLYSLSQFTYKGIAINEMGQILPSTSINVRITIIKDATIQYQETHNGIMTDQFAGFVVEVGTGTVITGNLSQITITANTRIKGEIDTGGGTWILSALESLTEAMDNALNEIKNYAWGLKGNSGILPGTNFLGTTDNSELRMEVRNSGTVEQSLRINGNQAIYRESSLTGIIPGSARGQFAVDMQINRENVLEVASGTESVVSGGFKNTASGDQSVVSGGESNSAQKVHATVGGGVQNDANGVSATVAGGSGNSAINYAATVGGGNQNDARGISSIVAGGFFNTAKGGYSTVGGGSSNLASGTGATVIGGMEASADKYGEFAFASGKFTHLGDAQTNVFVVSNQTQNASQTSLYLDGAAQANSMTLNDQDLWTFRAIVVGGSNYHNNYGSYIVTGFIHRYGLTTTISGVTTTTIDESSSAYNATAAAIGDALVIRVNGDATNTMRWVARVEVSQLNF